jgi:hypothetical protein
LYGGFRRKGDVHKRTSVKRPIEAIGRCRPFC